jgi:hypothetical protein
MSGIFSRLDQLRTISPSRFFAQNTPILAERANIYPRLYSRLGTRCYPKLKCRLDSEEHLVPVPPDLLEKKPEFLLRKGLTLEMHYKICKDITCLWCGGIVLDTHKEGTGAD